MSRSALWRQEANIQERERQAQDVFLNAVEEGRVRAKSKDLRYRFAIATDFTRALLSWIPEQPSQRPRSFARTR